MYAIIKNNKVICLVDYQPSMEDLSLRDETYVLCDTANIGDDYDGTNFSPPPPIITPFSELQEQKWSYIKSCRDTEERTPLPYKGKLLDFDTLASERLTWAISTAMTAKLTSQSFSIDWTTFDGSVLTMTENDILGIPLAVANRSNVVHQKAREKALEITSAITVEELQLIVW